MEHNIPIESENVAVQSAENGIASKARKTGNGNGNGRRVSKETIEGPTPRFSGTFSVYDTPDGGIHIAWVPNDVDSSETQHIDLPGAILNVIRQMHEGGRLNPMELMKAMMQGGFGE